MPDLCARAVPTALALPPFRSTSKVIPFTRVMPMVFRCVPKGYGCIRPLSLPTPTAIASSAIAVPCSFLNEASKRAITSSRQEERMRQAKTLCIERPKVRNDCSVERLNTLTYILINVKQ
jgi:hypothetical protein